MRAVAIVLSAFALVACAATGPATYGPAEDGRFGYSDMRIESDRYRVVYRGSGGMPPEQVEDFALRRAAELTIENGFDWFRIIAFDMGRDDRGGVSLGAGFGTGTVQRRTGVGVGVGGDLGTVGSQTYFTARIEIILGEGEPPEDDNAYDARSVLSFRDARLQRRIGEGAELSDA